MGPARPTLSIVMPVFNEAENIAAVLQDLRAVRTAHELLLVYDNDNDPTLPVVRSHARRADNVRLVRNVLGSGVLNAMRTGMDEAAAPLILVMMADRADDTRDIDSMVARAQGGVDLVAASRY